MEEQSFKHFSNTVLNRGSHKYSITNCFGVRDAWRYIRTDKWKMLKGNHISSSVYKDVIGYINKLLIEELLKGHEIILPYSMGILKIIGYQGYAKIKDGCLCTNYTINWKETIKNWYNDSEALKHRQLLRKKQDYFYKVVYNNMYRTYKNKSYYRFRPNRSLCMRISRESEQGKLNILIK